MGKSVTEYDDGQVALAARPNKYWPPTGSTRIIGCSWAAAVCATFVGYPLDTVKTRLQTYHYPNFWVCIRSTQSAEGFAAFYRGITASLISGSTARAFTMSLYTSLLTTYQSVFKLQSEKHPVATFLSGLTAGAASTLFTSPFEFAKTASQVEALVYKSRGLPEPAKMGALRAVKEISRRGGFKQMYGGYRYHLMRDSLGSGIYFSVYEHVKATMSTLLPAENGKPHPFSVVIAGGICGIISWVCVYPLDTMKSEYQRDLYSHSLASSLEFRETIVRRPKLRFNLSMYRGLGFSVLRTCLNGVALFSCYEHFLYWTSSDTETVLT